MRKYNKKSRIRKLEKGFNKRKEQLGETLGIIDYTHVICLFLTQNDRKLAHHQNIHSKKLFSLVLHKYHMTSIKWFLDSVLLFCANMLDLLFSSFCLKVIINLVSFQASRLFVLRVVWTIHLLPFLLQMSSLGGLRKVFFKIAGKQSKSLRKSKWRT